MLTPYGRDTLFSCKLTPYGRAILFICKLTPYGRDTVFLCNPLALYPRNEYGQDSESLDLHDK